MVNVLQVLVWHTRSRHTGHVCLEDQHKHGLPVAVHPREALVVSIRLHGHNANKRKQRSYLDCRHVTPVPCLYVASPVGDLSAGGECSEHTQAERLPLRLKQSRVLA